MSVARNPSSVAQPKHDPHALADLKASLCISQLARFSMGVTPPSPLHPRPRVLSISVKRARMALLSGFNFLLLSTRESVPAPWANAPTRPPGTPAGLETIGGENVPEVGTPRFSAFLDEKEEPEAEELHVALPLG
jgi:hypothetical protein